MDIVVIFIHCNHYNYALALVTWVPRETLVKMLINCKGKLDFCQGKAREMSGNFNSAGA